MWFAEGKSHGWPRSADCKMCTPTYPPLLASSAAWHVRARATAVSHNAFGLCFTMRMLVASVVGAALLLGTEGQVGSIYITQWTGRVMLNNGK